MTPMDPDIVKDEGEGGPGMLSNGFLTTRCFRKVPNTNTKIDDSKAV